MIGGEDRGPCGTSLDLHTSCAQSGARAGGEFVWALEFVGKIGPIESFSSD